MAEPFQMDMSERERQHFARILRQIAEYATQAAACVGAAQDCAFIQQMMYLGIFSADISEILEMIKSTLDKEQARSDTLPTSLSWVDNLEQELRDL